MNIYQKIAINISCFVDKLNNNEEFKKFISVEEDIKLICLFKVLYYCGIRRGELRGLTWKNIDLEKKSLSVVQKVVNVSGDDGYWQITTPKTRTSTRTTTRRR